MDVTIPIHEPDAADELSALRARHARVVHHVTALLGSVAPLLDESTDLATHQDTPLRRTIAAARVETRAHAAVLQRIINEQEAV